MPKEFYTAYYPKPRTRDAQDAMVSTLATCKADIARVEPGPTIVVTWDCCADESHFSETWKEEASKYLSDVAESVLATIKDIGDIELVGVPFDELFYYCDEILSADDVRDALKDLEYMGLIEFQDWSGYVLKTDIAIR